MNAKPPVSTWPLVVGVGFLAISLIFFMALVLIAVLLRMEVPFDSRFLVVIILSLTTATGSAFLGGYAKASGKLSLPFLKDPLTFWYHRRRCRIFSGATFWTFALFGQE